MERDFQEGSFQLTKVFEYSVLGTSTSYLAYPATAGAKNQVYTTHIYRQHFELLPTNSQAEKLKSVCSRFLLIPPALMASSCNLKSGTHPSRLLKEGPYREHSTRVKPGFAQHRHVQCKVELTENACKLSARHTRKHHKL